MNDNERPVALITGGSAGLGLVIAQKMVASGYGVMIVGRNEQRLQEACRTLSPSGTAKCIVADVSEAADVNRLVQITIQEFERIDVLVNCVGTSDRGFVENLSTDHLDGLLRQNVMTALLCCQAALPHLEKSSGVIVNIGSLAGKVGARYIGGYATAKHALSGMTQQLRLELKPRGVHVALVSPGPLRRDDAGNRYSDAVDPSLPAQAGAPGGGTRLSGLPPERVAEAVLRCVRKRCPDIILPKYLRLLIAIGHCSPRLGDWLLLKFTSPKDSTPSE